MTIGTDCYRHAKELGVVYRMMWMPKSAIEAVPRLKQFQRQAPQSKDGILAWEFLCHYVSAMLLPLR
jgi:hypothetical protein